jgi:Tfp pilus assembly protein PilV
MAAQKIAAIVVGVIGLAGLGVGTAYQVMEVSKRNNAQILCPTMTCQSQTGINAWNDVASTQTIATVAFIAGGAGVLGSAVLWLTSPHASGGPSGAASAQLSFGPGSVQLRGAW